MDAVGERDRIGDRRDGGPDRFGPARRERAIDSVSSSMESFLCSCSGKERNTRGAEARDLIRGDLWDEKVRPGARDFEMCAHLHTYG